MNKHRIRNSCVWEQIMQQRIRRILSRNARIKKGYLPRPASYFDLSEHFSTTTQATGSLTLQDLQKTIATLRAGEQQSYHEYLYKPEIIRTPWKMPIGGVL